VKYYNGYKEDIIYPKNAMKY